MKISQDLVILNQVAADSKLHPITHHKGRLSPRFKIIPLGLFLGVFPQKMQHTRRLAQHVPKAIRYIPREINMTCSEFEDWILILPLYSTYTSKFSLVKNSPAWFNPPFCEDMEKKKIKCFSFLGFFSCKLIHLWSKISHRLPKFTGVYQKTVENKIEILI